MERRIFRRLVVGSLLVALAIPLGGVAHAYLRGPGGGAGSASTGTTVAVTLSPGIPAAALYPGGQANVVLNASNPNASPVRMGSLALDTSQGSAGFAVDAGHSGCATSTLSFSTQTNGGAGWTLTPNATLQITMTNALSMGVGAASACQGANLTVYLAAAP